MRKIVFTFRGSAGNFPKRLLELRKYVDAYPVYQGDVSYDESQKPGEGAEVIVNYGVRPPHNVEQMLEGFAFVRGFMLAKRETAEIPIVPS